MKNRKVATLVLLFALSAAMMVTLEAALRASAAPDPGPAEAAQPPPPEGRRSPQTEFSGASADGTRSAHGGVGPAGVSTAGDVLGVFSNTWSYSTIGLVFDPIRNHMRYVHESQSSSHNPTIYDIDTLTHGTIQSIALSVNNPGWPW